MTSKQEDENYWNHSDSKAFSFDDEDFINRNRISGGPIKSSFVADIIFEGIPQKAELEKRPLETLISNLSLQRIFQEHTAPQSAKLNVEEELKILQKKVKNMWVPQSVTKTINLILLGQPYSLHLYRSLDSKKELLDEAIKSGDGNAILAIVIFLSNTLKKGLFYQILQTRPVAVAQYIQFLNSRVRISELLDLLEMVGQRRDASMRQFGFIIQGDQNKVTKLEKLRRCSINHFSLLGSNDEQLVIDYTIYLEWLLMFDTHKDQYPESSVLTSLGYLCKNHFDHPITGNYSPWFLVRQQNISHRQLHWAILMSRSNLQSWNDIDTHFLTKGWLSGRKVKGIISIEKIISELFKCGAPYSVLEKYFEAIGSYEKRLEVAKQLPCPRAVIDALVLMKDRQGIQEFKMNLKPQSEEYLHAESVLNFPIKWKN